jgi:hypothetical protein
VFLSFVAFPLALARQGLSAASTDAARKFLRPMVAAAPKGMPLWTRQYLAGDGYCSPGLQLALGVEIGNRDVMKRLGIQPRLQTPPPRSVHFEPRHIPQHLARRLVRRAPRRIR